MDCKIYSLAPLPTAVNPHYYHNLLVLCVRKYLKG